MAAVDRTKYMDARETKQLRTVTEAQAIMDLKDGRLTGVLRWALVDVALQTGLRVSEIAKLTIGDVDLKRGALKVWRHKRKQPSQETLAIAPELVSHLKDYLAWKDTVEGARMPQDALFGGKRGPLTSSGLQRIWHRAIEAAGLPKELSIHSARHTVAVHLLRKTSNLRQVQKQLGHASPATTANMYADVSFEDMQDGMAGLYGGGE